MQLSWPIVGFAMLYLYFDCVYRCDLRIHWPMTVFGRLEVTLDYLLTLLLLLLLLYLWYTETHDDFFFFFTRTQTDFPPNSKLFEKSSLTPPLGIRILPLLRIQRLTWIRLMIPVSDTLPWSQFEPQICLSLTKYRKDTTKPEVYKQVFLEIASRHQNYV